jgi:hypothetical protein
MALTPWNEDRKHIRVMSCFFSVKPALSIYNSPRAPKPSCVGRLLPYQYPPPFS